MAALIIKTNFEVTKRQSICALSVAVQICRYSDSPRIIKDPTTASLKRGTGGRSSFSGIVCTVFGNTGFLGRYVCNQLGKMGSQLILPYRGEHYSSMHLKVVGDLGQVLFHPFHLFDEESIRKCIKYSNTVVNLIGRDWETNNFTYNDVNVEGARTLARLSKEAGVERFIHVSCLNADPNPKPIMLPEGSAILKSKWEGECAVKEEFPEATIIRPADIYANDDTFLNCIFHRYKRAGRSIPLWEKGVNIEKQPVWASNVAAGIAATVRDPDCAGKTYQFVGPKRYKYVDLLYWLHEIARREKDWGFAVRELKYCPTYYARIAFNNYFTFNRPFANLTWETLEKEHTSDRIRKNIPMLEDLGITPIEMEIQAPVEMLHLIDWNTDVTEIIDFEPPVDAKTVPIRYT